MTTVPAKPAYFRADAVASEVLGVDRENKIIRGYVVAEEGETKTKGRAEFDLQSLEMLATLGNAEPAGIPMHFQHQNASDDGLGKFVGRAKNFRVDQRSGRAILRADSHISETAMMHSVSGGTPYGEYLMSLAAEDPGALQTSIVITRDAFQERKGKAPIIRPPKLIGSDFVQQGDAVHGDLFSLDGLDEFMEGSARRLPTKLAAAAAEYLNQMFPDSDRDVVAARIEGFKTRYLDLRFGAADETSHEGESAMDQETKDSLELLTKAQAATDEKLSKLVELFSTDRAERKAELSAKDRASEITALFEMSGVGQKGELTKCISDESMSVEDVRKMLFERRCKTNPPAEDDAEGEGNFSSRPDENEKYREEFAANRSLHEKLGITESRFIARRRKEDGLPAEAAK